jgi:hypothetical protein
VAEVGTKRGRSLSRVVDAREGGFIDEAVLTVVEDFSSVVFSGAGGCDLADAPISGEALSEETEGAADLLPDDEGGTAASAGCFDLSGCGLRGGSFEGFVNMRCSRFHVPSRSKGFGTPSSEPGDGADTGTAEASHVLTTTSGVGDVGGFDFSGAGDVGGFGFGFAVEATTPSSDLLDGGRELCRDETLDECFDASLAGIMTRSERCILSVDEAARWAVGGWRWCGGW